MTLEESEEKKKKKKAKLEVFGEDHLRTKSALEGGVRGRRGGR